MRRPSARGGREASRASAQAPRPRTHASKAPAAVTARRKGSGITETSARRRQHIQDTRTHASSLRSARLRDNGDVSKDIGSNDSKVCAHKYLGAEVLQALALPCRVRVVAADADRFLRRGVLGLVAHAHYLRVLRGDPAQESHRSEVERVEYNIITLYNYHH